MSWPLERKVSTAFWVMMVILFFTRLDSLQSLLKLNDTSALVARSYDALTALEAAHAMIHELEAAERGVLISTQPDMLERYRMATNQVHRQLWELRFLAAEAEQPSSPLRRLQAAISARLAASERLLSTNVAHGFEAAGALMLQSSGDPAASDPIRNLVDELKRERTAQMQQERDEMHQRFKQRALTFSVFTAFDFLLLIAAYYLVTLYIREKSRTERVLYEDAQLRAAIIATQNDIAAERLDRGRLMALIAKRAQDLTRAQGALIELEQGDELVVSHATGAALPLQGQRFAVATSLSGLAICTDEILLCEDTEKDPRMDRAEFHKAGIRSMMVVPLRHAHRGIGVLRLVFTKPNAFGEREIQTLVLLSGFLSAALGHVTPETSADHPQAQATPR